MSLRIKELPPDLDPEANIKVAIGTHESHRCFNVTGYWGYSDGSLELVLPDTVAEFYRAQGRRQIQSELRDLLAAARR